MSKVVSLADYKKEKEDEVRLSVLCDELDKAAEGGKKKDLAKAIFYEAERRNKENKEKMAAERKKNNKKVTKTYKLKR